jgi:hypothetical protein
MKEGIKQSGWRFWGCHLFESNQIETFNPFVRREVALLSTSSSRWEKLVPSNWNDFALPWLKED